MKLHILSDIHLEFGDFVLPETDADVIVVAGDVAHGIGGLNWLVKSTDKPVLYVPGNHEFYGYNRSVLLKVLHDACPGTNVTVMDDVCVEIGGIVFIGSTLWTDFNLYGNPTSAMFHGRSRMNDFHCIRTDNGTLVPHDVTVFNGRSMDFIEKTISSNEKCVVVTHHAPLRCSIHPDYGFSLLNACFASDYSDFLDRFTGRIPLWIHGHMHNVLDYMYKDTRVVCNPRGYVDKEKTGFNPGLVVEV